MSPEQSPSKGWRGTAADMHVEAGRPDLEAIQETAQKVREAGCEEIAERLEAAVERGREVYADA